MGRITVAVFTGESRYLVKGTLATPLGCRRLGIEQLLPIVASRLAAPQRTPYPVQMGIRG